MEHGAIHKHEAQIDRWWLIVHYCCGCSAGESARLWGINSTAKHGHQVDDPTRGSRHTGLPSLNFCSPVCDMPILRHPRCLDEKCQADRPPAESLQNPRCGDRATDHHQAGTTCQEALTVLGAIPRGVFDHGSKTWDTSLRTTSWSQSAARIYQESICYYSTARQAQGYTGIDGINNGVNFCVNSVIACHLPRCYSSLLDADDPFADDRYTVHPQPMIAFDNARSPARRLVANGRRLQRSNRQTTSISVGRNSADPSLAWLNRLHRA